MFKKNRVIKQYLYGIGLLIALMFYTSSQAAQLIASVDKNRISINDTFVLTLNFNDQAKNNQLNYSTLNRDFVILSARPNSSSQFQFINGKSTQSINVTWRFELAPRRIGRARIPAFNINGVKSQPITIDVTNNASQSNANQPVTAEIILSSRSPRVDQEVMITFRFGFANGATPNGFDFNLKNTNLTSITLGQNSFSRVNNGIRTNFVDVRYAVHPNKMGSLIIPAQLITANFRGRRHTARTQATILNVLKRLQNQQYPRAQWLPAKSVHLRAEWSVDQTEIEVGEPLSISIILEVDGQLSTLLPDINLPDVEQMSYYSDQPKVEQKNTPNGIQSTRIKSVAMIAKQAGNITIPEIVLPWWNIVAKKWEYAKIAQKDFAVKPASNLGGLPDTFQESALAIDLQSFEQQRKNISTLNYWRLTSFITITLLVIALLVIGYLLHRLKNSHIAAVKVQNTKAIKQKTERQLWSELLNAIQNNELQLFKKQLALWVQHRFKDDKTSSIEQLLKKHPQPELEQQLKHINQNLFAGGATEINWTAILQSIKKLRNNPTAKQKKAVVPDLYPKGAVKKTNY